MTEPALTPEEWASFPDWPTAVKPEGELPLYHPTRHGIAAANLYGQPYGFTHDDVRALSRCLDDAERWSAEHGWAGRAASQGEERQARDALRRIEALLPPEPPDTEYPEPCGATIKDGLGNSIACENPKGHKGRHRGHAPDDPRQMAQWPQGMTFTDKWIEL